jgi:hypothetical protein
MIATTRVGLLAGGVVLTLGSVGLAETSVEAQNEELRARVAQLEERLATVEAQDKDGWLTQQRASEIKGIVEGVLADADSRSSLMAQGSMSAGYDNGFVLGSADGNWMLRTNLLLQERFMIRAQDNPDLVVPGDGAGDASVWGFENTRSVFTLSGHVINPQWFYKVQIETASNDDATVSIDTGAVTTFRSDDREGLNESYIGYDYGNGVKVMMGTMKIPLLYEELVEDQYQQVVERSLVNYIFTGSYSDGLLVQYANDMIRVTGMYNNGIGTGGSAALVPDTDIAFAVRAEWLASGTWQQFNEYTSPQGEEMGILVGGAFQYQTAEADTPGLDIDFFLGTIDCSAQFGGGNVYGALIFANIDPAAASQVQPWAFQIGGGWYLHENWEIFGRYEFADTDDLTADDLSIITLGVNGYFHGQNAKWSTDVGFGLETVNFSVPVTGWAIDSAGNDGQFVLRTQLQLYF